MDDESARLDQLPAYLTAVRAFNDAQGRYNPAALAALHWAEAAVAELDRTRALVKAARAWFAPRYGSPPHPISDEELRRAEDNLAGAIDALDDHADEGPIDE